MVTDRLDSAPMRPPIIYLWQVPPEDFESWKALEDPGLLCKNYADHLRMLAQARADFEAKGYRVVRVHLSLAEMRFGLAQRRLPNIPAARKFVLKAAATTN